MIAKQVYTREEMQELSTHSPIIVLLIKPVSTATLIMRAEASSGMLRLFFRLNDGRK